VSQYIVDDELDPERVTRVLVRWTTVQRLSALRPGQVIKDERVPQLLSQPKWPTFVTIDGGFWDRTFCDERYCLLYFALREDEQGDPPLVAATGSAFGVQDTACAQRQGGAHQP